MFFTLAALCFALAMALWLIEPHFSSASSVTHRRDVNTLETDRHLYKEQLRELELDFETGKTTEQQYQQTKQELARKLAAVLETLEEH